MKTHKRLTLTAVCAIGMAGLAAAAVVVNPKVTTDRTVDTSSPDSILKAVLKGKTTPQEKAIALFEFQRLMVYHTDSEKCFGGGKKLNRDLMKSYNVFGCNLCGSQATTMVELAKKAACFEDQRVVSVPGHTIYELKYDGKWHTFDTMMNFYAFTDAAKTHIADLDELKANPDIAVKAVAEGRACPGYLLCGDTPTTFTKGRLAVLDYTYKVSEDQMNYSLCGGESWTRHFTPQFEAPAWCRPLVGAPPHHGCGFRDEKDPINFAYWEPYSIKKISSKAAISYRHWATGYWTYVPDFSDTGALKDADAKGVVAAGGVLRAAAPNQAGTFVYNLKHCPWLLVNGKVLAKATKGNAADIVKISVGATAETLQEVWSASAEGESSAAVDLSASLAPKGLWNYVVKVEITAADPAKTGVSEFGVNLGFVHNYPASPMLLPGANKIKLECAPESLKGAKLELTYSWFEVAKDKDKPEYATTAKTETKEIAGSPTEFAITTPATKRFPKMDFIRLECLASGAKGSQKLDFGKAEAMAATDAPAGAARAAPAAEAKQSGNTVSVPLKAEYATAKGEVGKKFWIIRWPKSAAAGGVVASVVVLSGDIKAALAGRGEIVAARVMVPIVEGYSDASSKIGVACLKAPIEVSKGWDAASVDTPVEGTVIPKLAEAQVITVDATSAVKAALAGAAFNGLALRMVPDRSVDDGYTVNCKVNPKGPITLEVEFAKK